MRATRSEIELLTDNAIETIEQDKFEREGFIRAIAEIIHSQSTRVNREEDAAYKKVDENLIVGIFGEWGFGKTSIINMLDSVLTKEKKLQTAYFNPWMYGSEDQLIKSLFNLIIDKCGLLKSEKNKLVALLKKYYPLVSIVSPFAGKVMDASINVIGKTEDTDATVLKNEIDKLLLGTANPLTIYIDDVDRLNKSEVQVLFKTLRLIASFKHVIYVVSCDFEMVAKSIKENYADGLVQDGRAFIDKIIQIPIRIPEIRPELLLNYGLEYIKKTVDIDLSSNTLFKYLFNQYLTSPRDVKRFVNSFRFTYNFIGESIVAPDDLITIELIKAKASIQFSFIKLYYKALTLSADLDNFYSIRKEFMEENLPHLLNAKGGIRGDTNEIEMYYKIFKNLFNLHYERMQFYSNTTSGSITDSFSQWRTTISNSKKQTFYNPEVFQQYMELRMNQKD